MNRVFSKLLRLCFGLEKPFQQKFAESVFFARSAYKYITQRLNFRVRLVGGYSLGGVISGVENGGEHIQDRGDPHGRLLDDNSEIELRGFLIRAH
jgi:hypothetical protein